ncbi:MAG: DNA repair protein RecO [Tissierellia bacterium]|nr:DNA repair protein RecO [Tissierellia bacterium]
MATKRSLESRGIVLSEAQYRETSKIIQVYTEELGKISVLCKGAHRPSSSLLFLTQSFSHNDFILGRGRSFYYLQGGQIIESNLALRRNFTSMVHASLITEIIEKTSLEGHGHRKVYGLLARTLDLGRDIKNWEALLAAFIIKYVSYMGYRPRLDLSKEDLEEEVSFVINKGGLVVAGPLEVGGSRLSPREIYSLQQMLYNALNKAFLDDLPRDMSKKLSGLMVDYLQYNLEINKLHSLSLME